MFFSTHTYREREREMEGGKKTRLTNNNNNNIMTTLLLYNCQCYYMEPAAANFQILSSLRGLTADFFFVFFSSSLHFFFHFRLNFIVHINRGLACTNTISNLMLRISMFEVKLKL